MSRHLCRDIDEQAACLAGYDQRYQQLEPGPYHGEFTSALLGEGAEIHIESMNKALLQQGGVPAGCQAIGFLIDGGGRSLFNGTELGRDSVILLGPGDDFEATLAAGSRFCVVALGSVGADASTQAPAHGHRHRAPVVALPGGLLAETRAWVQAQCTGVSPFGPLPSAAHAIAEIHRHAATAAHAATPLRINAADRYRLYRRARNWMDTHADSPASVADMCRHIGASRRALEYAFQACVGMGPSAFLRGLRLHGVHRDLLAAAAPDGPPIGEIAARWGFWHPSRFAAEYRSLFGELPSLTRQRARH